jgi:multidrug resistance efflux pump
VDFNSYVKKGQLLAQIDAAAFDAKSNRPEPTFPQRRRMLKSPKRP